MERLYVVTDVYYVAGGIGTDIITNGETLDPLEKRNLPRSTEAGAKNPMLEHL